MDFRGRIPDRIYVLGIPKCSFFSGIIVEYESLTNEVFFLVNDNYPFR